MYRGIIVVFVEEVAKLDDTAATEDAEDCCLDCAELFWCWTAELS